MLNLPNSCFLIELGKFGALARLKVNKKYKEEECEQAQLYYTDDTAEIHIGLIISRNRIICFKNVKTKHRIYKKATFSQEEIENVKKSIGLYLRLKLHKKGYKSQNHKFSTFSVLTLHGSNIYANSLTFTDNQFLEPYIRALIINK